MRNDFGVEKNSSYVVKYFVSDIFFDEKNSEKFKKLGYSAQ